MAWTISKCHRVLRPLTTQLSRYQTEANLTTIDSEECITPRLETVTDCLDTCRASLPIECYERGMAVVGSYGQFLVQCTQVRWTLATRSAFHVGECIVLTQNNHDSNDWHAAVDSLGGCGDRFRQYVCMGNAVACIIAKSTVLKPIMPALILVSLDHDQPMVSQKLFAAYLETISQDEFYSCRDWIVRMASKLNMTNKVVAKLLAMDICLDNFPSTMGLLYKLEYISGSDLEILAIQLLGNAKKCSGYAMQLMELVFARIQRPSARCMTKLLRKLPPIKPFASLRKVIQLYTNYKLGSKWLNLTPEDDANELSAKFVSLYRHDVTLFKTLVEYLYPAHPPMAVEASSRFITRYPHLADMKMVMWQDKLASRELQESAGADDFYDQTMGVWFSSGSCSSNASEDEAPPAPSRKRRRQSCDPKPVEDDEFSLIKLPNKRQRRRSSGIKKPVLHEVYDDISLIVV